MSVWVWSGQTALWAGTAVFALAFFPLLAWQFRRYGTPNVRRMLGAAAYSLYLTALVTYTWLPLPPRTARWCRRHGIEGVADQPLHAVSDITQAVAGQGAVAALTNPVVLQVVFNVVLFLPWGVLMRRYLGKPVWFATLTGFAASLFIEVTQYTGLWGLYPCAYRTADVDDLITNTLGALIGALLAPLLLWWMPSERLAAAKRLTPRPVTMWRRWIGMAIDGAALLLISSLLGVLFRVALLATAGRHVMEANLGRTDLLAVVITWLLVFIVPTLDRGGSLGAHIVWLIPQWRRPGSGELYDGTIWQRLIRTNIVGLPWLIAASLGLSTGFTQAWPGVLLAGCALVAVASVAMVPFTRDHRSLSYLLTGAVMDDERNTEDDD